MSIEVTSNLVHALAYARAGLRVLPLNGKLPRNQNGSTGATLDEDIINKWWRLWPTADIGIATGDGLIVVDFDIDTEMTPAQAELFNELDKDWLVKTGGGGYHVYYTCHADISNSASSICERVDIRGRGGYVVAPPSNHSSGNAYEWAMQEGSEPPLAPEHLIARIARSGRTGSTKPAVAPGEPIPEGMRNDVLYRDACAMRRRGFDYDTILDAIKKRAVTGPAISDAEYEQIASGAVKHQPEDVVAISAPAPETVAMTLSELDTLTKEDPGAPFTEPLIASLSAAEDENGAEWARAVAILRKHGLVRSVKTALIEYRKEQLPPPKPSEEWDDAPLKLTIPGDWRCREDGVWRVKDEGMEERVLPVPVYLSKRLKDIDTGEERVELQWRKDGSWNTLTCARSVASTAQAITSLADHGLPVTSVSSGDLVKYLSDLEAANTDIIPLELSAARTGWIGADRFIPGLEDGVLFDPPGWSMTNMFNGSGTLEQWGDGIKPYRDKYPLVRAQLAASFAAPLLMPLNHRNFILHLWGMSATGKTATLRAAASVWASRKMMVSFNSTPFAMTNHAAMLNHLPVCINERQVGDKRMDKVIYSLAEGVARMQGAKSGGNRHMGSWQSIILTNGEEPLTSEHGMQGTRTRAIELQGSPVSSEIEASQLYDITDTVHGMAGPAYIKHLLAQEKGTIKDFYNVLKLRFDDVAESEQSRSHVTAVALLCTADYYASIACFGLDHVAAMDEALAHGDLLISDHLETGEELDQGVAVIDLIRSMASAKTGLNIAGTFEGHTSHDRWGFIEDDKLWILASHLREYLGDRDVSIRAARLQMMAAGQIRTRVEGKRTRYDFMRDGVKYNVIRLSPTNEPK